MISCWRNVQIGMSISKISSSVGAALAVRLSIDKSLRLLRESNAFLRIFFGAKGDTTGPHLNKFTA